MSTYLMESPYEGDRVKKKTLKEITLEHLSIAGIEKDMDVIDIGCASGEVLRQIAEMATQGKVVGFDGSVERIEESKKHDSTRNIDNIEYVAGNVYHMDAIASDAFDIAWSRFLFEYLKRPLDALHEIKRILRPGGKAVIIDLDGNCVFHYPIRAELQREINEVIEIINARAGFDPYVGRKLPHMMKMVGFRNISVDILPYHQIFGTPSDSTLQHWAMKIDILKTNFFQLVPELSQQYEHVFDEFLDLIRDPETLTYSTVFLVQGWKKS